MKPVYVAGRGLASVLGLDLGQALGALKRGIQAAPSPYAMGNHGEVPYLRITDESPEWEARARALVTRVAKEAGADTSRYGALFIATSCLDGDAVEQSWRDMDFHAFSGRIGGWLGWNGPVFIVSTACTSGIQALLSAVEWLRAEEASEALVLGLELDNRLTVPGFAALQLLSRSRSKPFAVDRDGLVLGEAVAALRLSTVHPGSWLLRGGSNVVDGAQPTTASPGAVVQMVQRTLASCGMTSDEVDLVKVQAAGSPANDAAEAHGLQQAFVRMPALVSLKPLIGHCMGASGVAEVALLLECLERGHWPQYSDASDPSLGVTLATQMPSPLRCLLACILGFGGGHSAVVLERSGV
jgi:3-oxoacyl-[acyl-carrier-protein] synthase-1